MSKCPHCGQVMAPVCGERDGELWARWEGYAAGRNGFPIHQCGEPILLSKRLLPDWDAGWRLGHRVRAFLETIQKDSA